MIYLDLDGVLADFRSWVLSKDPEAFDKEGDVVCGIIVEHYKECFRDFRFIEKNRHLVRLGHAKVLTVIPAKAILKYCMEHDISMNKAFKIITQLKANKIYWCKRNLWFDPQDIIFCNTRSEKLLYAVDDAILYDDCEETIHSWRKTGCQGILVESER